MGNGPQHRAELTRALSVDVNPTIRTPQEGTPTHRSAQQVKESPQMDVMPGRAAGVAHD
jgi:hypothetical protein